MEAPRNDEELHMAGDLPGHKVANMIKGGSTPLVPVEELGRMGFSVAIYSVTLLSVSIRAMQESLGDMASGKHPTQRLLDFADLRHTIGFDAYGEEERRYADGE